MALYNISGFHSCCWAVAGLLGFCTAYWLIASTLEDGGTL